MNPKTLVLLDIDGTLLDAAGQGREAFHDALEFFFPGHEFPRFSMAGRTDRGLWSQFAALAPHEGPSFRTFLDQYAIRLEARLAVTPPTALPGVAALLRAIEDAPDLHPGLVTGNVLEGTRLKLGHCGLLDPFLRTGMLPATYGHEALDKGTLALEALTQWTGPAKAVLVGDTPEDVRCARLAGIPCVGVATGGFDAFALMEAGAEVVLPDLADTDLALVTLRTVARLPESVDA